MNERQGGAGFVRVHQLALPQARLLGIDGLEVSKKGLAKIFPECDARDEDEHAVIES